MQHKQQKVLVNKDEGSIVEMLASYLPYWPLFLIFLLVGGGGAFFYLRYTVPKYSASATIIIKDENKAGEDSRLMQSLDQVNSKKIIENEIEVLQSRTLMIAVAKKLHLYAPFYQEGKVKTISAYTISPLVVEAREPDKINYHEKITLNFDAKNGTVVLDNSFKGGINQWLNTPYGILKFRPNQNYYPGSDTKPIYFSLMSPKTAAGWIMGDLKVYASSKLSSVIILNLLDEVPKRAEDILNELVSAYGEAAINEKNFLAKNTLAFLETRLNIVSKDLDSVEAKLQQYKAGKGAVDIGRQGALYLDNVSANDKKLSDLNMQADVLSQLEKAATSSGNVGMLPSTLGINDPALNQQMNSLSTLQLQYERLKPTVAENNPLLLSITEQINQIKPSILNNIQSQRRNLELSRGSISSTAGSYRNILSAIPQKERQLLEISRDQQIKSSIYSFLLQKKEEAELSYASNLPDSRIVNYAQATDEPVSPKRMIIYVMAFSFSLGFPILLIAGREVLSPKVLYRHEIESKTSIPIIGEIGFNKTKELMVVASGKRTVGVEEFRKIRISLLSLGINDQHKKILITSSISGEGKSYISANLAASISLTGKKVVIVDVDLHNPGLGKYFGTKDHTGVSDFLMGKCNIRQITQPVSGNENLFYISSGKLQQDASELLENGKIKTLISHLDSEYDMVIIDTAPVVLITDAYLLSPLCDATLYVIRHKFTPKMFVKRIEDNLEINPINNPGIIFNGVKTRGFFKNNYGYGYNNYVYSYDNKEKAKSIS